MFLEDRDYMRFLFLVLFFQSKERFRNISRHIKYFVDGDEDFGVDFGTVKSIVDFRLVRLIAFCAVPTHFHLIVEEVEEGGVSYYLMRIQDAYTKYFNTKHETSGHVFKGPFGATHIEDNDQLLYTSTYIHKHPQEITGKIQDNKTYRWSSYQDYIGENRWPKLLDTNIITKQFGSAENYQQFVKESVAKEKPEDRLF